MTTATLERYVANAPVQTTAPVWRNRIYYAVPGGRFTRTEKDAAMKFRTCAVGEIFGFPEELSIANVPQPLRNLGMQFLSAVHNDRVGDAERILNEIEAEAVVLLS